MKAIKSIHDVISAALKMRQKFGKEVWWRGHASDGWSLTPRVFRERYDEADLFAKFRMRARTRYKRCPDHDDLASWLLLAQHFGLPTRILDWTESVLVAAFFCVRDPGQDSKSGMLWALNPVLLNQVQHHSESNLLHAHGASCSGMFGRASTGRVEESSTYAVLPDETDLRMLLQQSVFTIHDKTTPLERHPRGEEFLQKYDIPAASKALLRDQLALLGIRESTLFPDLDHLALDLGRWPSSGG